MHDVNPPLAEVVKRKALKPLQLNKFTLEAIKIAAIFWKQRNYEKRLCTKRLWEKNEGFNTEGLLDYLDNYRVQVANILKGENLLLCLGREELCDVEVKVAAPTAISSNPLVLNVINIKNWIRITELDIAIAALSNNKDPISKEKSQSINKLIEKEFEFIQTNFPFPEKRKKLERQIRAGGSRKILFPPNYLAYFFCGSLLSASLNWALINNRTSETSKLFEEIKKMYFVYSNSPKYQLTLYDDGICSKIADPSFDLYKRLLQAKMLNSEDFINYHLEEQKQNKPIEVPFLKLYFYSLLAVYDNHNLTHHFYWLKNENLTALFNTHLEAFEELKVQKRCMPSMLWRRTESIVYLMNTIDLVSDNLIFYTKGLSTIRIEAPIEIIPSDELVKINSIEKVIKKKKSVNHGKALPIAQMIINPWISQSYYCLSKFKFIVRNFLLDTSDKNFPEGIVFSQSIFKRLEEGASLEEIRALRKIVEKAEQNNIDTAQIWKDGRHFFINSTPTADNRVIRKSEIDYRKAQYELHQAINFPNEIISELEAHLTTNTKLLQK